MASDLSREPNTYLYAALDRAEDVEAQLAALQSRYDEAVELLREIGEQWCGVPGHAVAVGCGCPERARAFLAKDTATQGAHDE